MILIKDIIEFSIQNTNEIEYVVDAKERKKNKNFIQNKN